MIVKNIVWLDKHDREAELEVSDGQGSCLVYSMPCTVRQSQKIVDSLSCDGRLLSDVISGLKSGSINPDSFPPVRVFKRGNLLFTLDNRRLKAFQEAGLSIKTIPATSEDVAKEAWKLTTTTDGISIRVRNGGI